MELTPEIKERLTLLENKYAVIGQDLKSYLDGLLYADPLTYWDYVHTDTLLSLQNTKTDFPDEMVFLMYHQITELYFKLTLHELYQIAHNGKDVAEDGEDKGWKERLDADFFLDRIFRINQYFKVLIESFEIMVKGMEQDQFHRFRMALLPASGFQSAQYRKIEIYATDFINLVKSDMREELSRTADTKVMFDYVYWKQGASELATGKKTLTLRQFEEKYSKELIKLARECSTRNLWKKYHELTPQEQQREDIINGLKQFDVNVNINWPLVHYKSAVRYLQQSEKVIAATGGTNWQQYLPPKFQKRIFYPELWSEQEKAEWGKGWVDDIISK